MVDGEELSGKGGWAGEAAVVGPELDEDEKEEAGGGAGGGDVEEVLDVAVPRGGGVVRVRRRRGRAGHGRSDRERAHGSFSLIGG